MKDQQVARDRDYVREALDVPRSLDFKKMAWAVGKSPYTLREYRLKRRRMPPQARVAYADVLRGHIDRLQSIVAYLDRTARAPAGKR